MTETTTTITVGSPDAQLVKRAQDAVEIAKSYSITCDELRAAASEDLKRVKALYNDIDDQEKSITKPINEGLKRVRALFAQPKAWLASAEQILKGECLRWDGEQDRKRREAEAEAARQAQAERERLDAIAAAEQKAGNVEAAQAIAQAAQLVAPAVVTSNQKQRIEGESTREIWRARVVDMTALCKGVADGTVSTALVLPNQPSLNGLARSLKSSLKLPGVEVYSERVLASTSARVEE